MYQPLDDHHYGHYRPNSHVGVKVCSNRFSLLFFIVILFFMLFVYLPFIHLGSNKPLAFVWPANQTRNATLLLEPTKSTTMLWPRDICSRSNNKNSSHSLTTALSAQQQQRRSNNPNNIYLLVIVCSAVNNFQERQVIRDTWAKDTEELSNVRVIFLLGQLKNATYQVNVTMESETYGDILQEGFIDTYANLTVKSLMLLKWFSLECDGVPYVFKTDDDMYINLKQLFQLVVANKKPNLLTGSLICGAVPIRDPHNKWFCPEYMFDRKSYPNYLSGTAYLMSRSAALTLYETALRLPVFHLEDIYVTGILAEQVGIRPEDHVGFSYLKRKLSACLFNQIISSHHMTAKEITDIYTKIHNEAEMKVCPKLKAKNLRTYGPGKCRWKKGS